MATQSENAEIAVLQTQMTDAATVMQEVRGDVKDIKNTVGALPASFVTRGEFNAFKKMYWLSHTLTALMTATITYLIIYFISGHK